MTDLDEVLRHVERVRDYVASEPGLAEFLPSMNKVVDNAARLLRGDFTPASIPLCRTAKIPSREIARNLLASIGGAPSVTDDEPRELRLAAARIYTNLFDAVVWAVMAQYPDLFPPSPPESEP
ncbi:MAG: hypothetical protein HYV09_36605 [Deltaproteobacteria bacterium]|nr:hypothetical protein [Deltaproteobacteria bacterium]